LGTVTLDEPDVSLTRTADGIVLPPPLGGQKPPAAEPVVATEAPKEAPPAAAGKVVSTVQTFTLQRGRIAVQDRTVKPFFAAEIKPLDLDVRGVRSDGPAVDRFTLSAATPGKGKLAVAGSLAPSGGKVEVNGTDIALAPYNPFVTAFSPYSLGARS